MDVKKATRWIMAITLTAVPTWFVFMLTLIVASGVWIFLIPLVAWAIMAWVVEWYARRTEKRLEL